MELPNEKEYIPLDIPDHPVCLDANFWEGIDPYMLCPTPVTTDSIDHIEGSFDSYQHEFDT